MYDCLKTQQQQQKYNPNRELYKTFLKISVMHWIKYEISIKYITKDVRFFFSPCPRWVGLTVQERTGPDPWGRSAWWEPWTRKSEIISQNSSTCWKSRPFSRSAEDLYLFMYLYFSLDHIHSYTHSHTQDVYSFRSETGCVLTRVAAGIMFFCSDCTAHPQPERPPLHLGRGIA